MGRGGILILGLVAVFETCQAMRATVPNNAVNLTILFALPQVALTLSLFLECRCGEKKDKPEQKN